MTLYDQLSERLTFSESPAWDSYDKVEKLLVATAAISDAVRAVYHNLRGTTVEQAELSDAITKLYAEFIEPLDIPGIGPVLETIVDTNAGRILSASVKALDALLDKHLNPAETK